MNIEERKLRLIKIFSTLEDEKKIAQIESFLEEKTSLEERTATLNELSGSWSEEEVDDFKKIIEGGCENVDKNEW